MYPLFHEMSESPLFVIMRVYKLPWSCLVVSALCPRADMYESCVCKGGIVAKWVEHLTTDRVHLTTDRVHLTTDRVH